MEPPSDAGRLTPRERAWLIGIGVLYAAVVIPIGIHKGGDFTQELTRSERLLSGVPLYVENPRGGIWWPPFTALGLVPFALVARWSLALAKAGWAALNVVSLGWTVARARAWTTGWTPVVLALAAVGKPLQSNYEHLNLTPILLALIVATAADLEARHDGRAGWWIGLATAIKGFPRCCSCTSRIGGGGAPARPAWRSPQGSRWERCCRSAPLARSARCTTGCGSRIRAPW